MRYSNSLDASQKILLGYYDLRGKIQICRLLCQYTGVPYINVFFTPPSWEKFKATNTLGSTFQELPFLKDKDFLVNQPYAIEYYIIKKSGREDLLGKTIEDQAIVDMFIWKAEIAGMIIGQFVRLKDERSDSKTQLMEAFWEKKLKKKMESMESICKQNFFLGYISLIDFYIYEMIVLLYLFYPQKVGMFPKITQVYSTIANLPQIREYQMSDRAIKNYDPIKYYQKWARSCGK